MTVLTGFSWSGGEVAQRRRGDSIAGWMLLVGATILASCSFSGSGAGGPLSAGEEDTGALIVTPDDPFVAVGPEGGPVAPNALTYTLANPSAAAVAWTASGDQAWLQLSSTGGTLAPATQTSVSVSIDAAIASGLTVGLHVGTVTFADASGTSVRGVVVDVRGAAMFVTPGAPRTATGMQGGPFDFTPTDFVVQNVGSARMQWTAESTEDWARVSIGGGVLDPGESETVTVRLDDPMANDAVAGIHTGSIDFVNESSGIGTTSRGVVLDAEEPAGLMVQPEAGYASTGPEGGPFLPATFAYELSNGSGEVLTWDASVTSTAFVLSPIGGFLQPGESTTLTISIDQVVAAGLMFGSNFALLTIENTRNGKGSTERPMSVEVTARPPVVGGGGATSDRLTQFGIEWVFDRAYEVGQFANGDWWVVGSVNIVGITPPSSKNKEGRASHGSMINPAPFAGMIQGYDSSMYAQYKSPGDYSPSANVALDVSPARPLRVPARRSLVSTISRVEGSLRPQILTAAVLTVLDAPAPRGSFRPAYSSEDKSIRFNESQLQYGFLGRLGRVAATPSLEHVEESLRRPWLDHVPLWIGRYTHPKRNMPDYGRDMADAIGTASLMLQLDFSNAQKRDLVVSLVQLGIDFYGIAENGGKGNWRAAAGHMSGRKWPILFAGIMLGDPDMGAVGFDPSIQFGEDGQTFYVQETGNGVFNNGHGGYARSTVGLPEWGTAHSHRPELDDSNWLGDPYRMCCTANSWWGQILSARIMGAQSLWNHDALFDYQDRYLAENTKRGVLDWRLAWTRFPMEMWKAYRSSF